jgi:hypothetical protein
MATKKEITLSVKADDALKTISALKTSIESLNAVIGDAQLNIVNAAKKAGVTGNDVASSTVKGLNNISKAYKTYAGNFSKYFNNEKLNLIELEKKATLTKKEYSALKKVIVERQKNITLQKAENIETELQIKRIATLERERFKITKDGKHSSAFNNNKKLLEDIGYKKDETNGIKHSQANYAEAMTNADKLNTDYEEKYTLAAQQYARSNVILGKLNWNESPESQAMYKEASLQKMNAWKQLSSLTDIGKSKGYKLSDRENQEVFDAMNDQKNEIIRENKARKKAIKEIEENAEIQALHNKDEKALDRRQKAASRFLNARESNVQTVLTARHISDITDQMTLNPFAGIQKNLSDKYSDLTDRRDANITQINRLGLERKETAAAMEKMKKDHPGEDLSKNTEWIKLNQEYSDENTSISDLGKENAGLAKSIKGTAMLGTAVSATSMIASTVIDSGKQIVQSFAKSLGFSLSIKDYFSQIADTVSEIVDKNTGMATYDTSTSLFSNAAAREQQMTYGLSSAQNYAFSQTKNILGIRSEDDLMYMNSDQRQLFSQFMTTYSNWYNQLSSSGVLADIQKMQLEFSFFKQQMAVSFLTWIGKNKDTIMTIMKTVMTLTERIIEIVGKILTFFTGDSVETSSISAATADSVSLKSSSTPAKYYNINMNMTNTATGVLSDQTQLENFFKDQMSKTVAQIGKSME